MLAKEILFGFLYAFFSHYSLKCLPSPILCPPPPQGPWTQAILILLSFEIQLRSAFPRQLPVINLS